MATKNNDKDGATVKGTSSADLITNDGANNVSIDAGKGNDTITVNGGHNVTVSGGAGNDHFYTEWGAGTAYVYTSGNDTLRGLHDSNVIVIANAWTTQTGDDNTTIINVAGKGTLTLIDCWDDWGEQISIVSSLNDVKSYKHTFNDENITTVSGGSGNDWIDNYGSRVSVNAGDGNNHIWNGEWYGDEYGAIRGHYTTLKTGKGTDFIWNAGDNVIIETGAGDDIVDNIHAKTANKIDLGAGNDSLINFAASSTISGGAGDDSIENNNDHDEHNWGNGSKVSIDAGAGNDTIRNNGGNDATINGGAGDDTITNEGKSSKIVVGAGNDDISNYAEKTFVDGGAGNDIIYNRGFNATILGDAGNDYIENSGSEVSINGGAGNDRIYNWSGGDNVTIVGGKGNDYVSDEGVGTAYVYSAGNDTLFHFDAFDTLVLGSVKVNSSVRADGNVTLKLSNKKTLTLQSYWADKVNIAKSIKGVKKVSVIRNDETNTVVKGTSKNDYIQNYGWSSNVTIAAGKGNDYIDNQAAQVSINAGAGNDSIYNVDNDSTILGGAGNDSIYNYGANISINGGAGNDSIINRGFDNTITGGTGNDHISLEVVGNLIKYASGDGKDTIIGFNESDTLTVSGGSYSTQASGSDVLVKVGKGSILLKDAKGKALNINDTKTTDIITLSDGADNLRNNFEGVKIQALGGNDTVDNYVSSVTIDGGKGNDHIYNDYADNVSISGGAGNDYLYNWARTEWNSDTYTYETVETGDNVTLSGGTGNDFIFNQAGVNVVFQYKTGDGNDSIYGFNDTSTLSIAGGTYTSTKSGDNVIVTVGKGKITLNGAANLETVNIDFSKLLTVTNKTSSPVTVAADVKVIDASTRTKAVKITGNKLDNEIYGGTKNDSIRGGAGADKIYGGSGNDTLWGDAGNDSLYGGAGKDTFIYKPGEDTDTIFDYDSGDMLKILKTNGKDGGIFTKGTFSKGNLTLAISGGGSVIFDGVSKGDVININGTNHTITGKTFK